MRRGEDSSLEFNKSFIKGKNINSQKGGGGTEIIFRFRGADILFKKFAVL